MFLIHIGRRKAGSTTIQSFFHQNADALEKAGLYYAEVGRTTKQHRDIARSFKSDISGPEIAAMKERLGYLASAHPDRKFFLSSESLEGIRTPSLAMLAEAISPHPVQIL